MKENVRVSEQQRDKLTARRTARQEEAGVWHIEEVGARGEAAARLASTIVQHQISKLPWVECILVAALYCVHGCSGG